MKNILVTGSAGLVGSHAVKVFHNIGWNIVGIDNDTRRDLFGPQGSVVDQIKLNSEMPNYKHSDIDICNKTKLNQLFKFHKFDAIFHTAAQPSHDWATNHVMKDFNINAAGTVNLLEMTRKYCPEAPFVYMSTNKVYGDTPNHFASQEREKRYDIVPPQYGVAFKGFDETLRIDHCSHSLYGASKLSADIYVQEYGRYFGMPTCCLRAGCITGVEHAGVVEHGFLNNLVRTALKNETYTVFGFKGKQVRDNLHPMDIASFVTMFIANPKPAAVYNIGGGRENSISILEAVDYVGEYVGQAPPLVIEKQPRRGDHRVWYTDTTKLQKDYPKWHCSIGVRTLLLEMVNRLREHYK